ncbi:response regulator [Pseudanabaena sp. UWO310]|uniref:response regulator n=1 Tax=Pseudanabaena sp. UWO310 TaxID=2480795 RepID=UPI00115893D6|nr:response regulator [Pseudanabaena sp. UWO310]TYQ31603.1 response regulator [Pseudanabaena sp. UWO310]
MKICDPILLIEDDPLDIMTLQRGFRDINAKNPLSICYNGEEALEFLSQPSNPTPALIISDLHMPRMNGLEFLKIVKSNPEWCKIPVVILTTSQEEEDRLTGFQLSVAGYFVKPFKYINFVEKLQIIYQYWCLNEVSSFIP